MMQRVIICLDSSTSAPSFVFGPFEEVKKSDEFLDEHEKICKRVHVQRRLNDPKFGVK